LKNTWNPIHPPASSPQKKSSLPLRCLFFPPSEPFLRSDSLVFLHAFHDLDSAFGIVLSRDGCDMRVGACAAELFSALCSACFARCSRAAVPPVTCFLPQPPGRCQCRWQGRRRRVQGGVVHSPAPLLPCLSHHFCRLTLLPKLRLLKQRQQVCVAFAPTPRCPPHAPPQPRLPWWPGVCEIRARILLWRQQHHNMLPVTVPRIRILLSPRRA
jgi:hypothetical protein